MYESVKRKMPSHAQAILPVPVVELHLKS